MTTFLRRVLHFDAATCLAMGALLTFAAAPLSPLLGLPAALLFWAGLALFPIGAFMFLVSTRPSIAVPGAWAVILGNAGWVAASLAVMVMLTPTSLGYAFVAAQAIVVGLLAELEYMGLRRIS